MRKNFKKAASFFMALLVVATTNTSILAISYDSGNVEQSETAIAPRYTYLGNVTAGMSITSKNKAKCTGSYYIYEDNNADITVKLMKSTDGKTNWSSVPNESWTKSYTTIGNHTSGGTSTTTLSSAYYYCTLTQVTVYDDNYNVLETASCWSSAYHI